LAKEEELKLGVARSGFSSRPTKTAKKARQVSKKKQTKLAASNFLPSLSSWVGLYCFGLFLFLPRQDNFQTPESATCRAFLSLFG
jgi:hypothetical protein